MNEREQFEAWAKKHGVQFVSRSSGEYTTGTVSLDALRELAALAASPVPAGYKLVPVEPTPEMLAAAWELDSSTEVSRGAKRADLYRAMLAAAPTTPNGLTESAASVPAPAQQAEAQPFGWAVLSRDATWGAFFGAAGRDKAPSATDFDNAAPGMAPHRVVAVHTAPAPSVEAQADKLRDAIHDALASELSCAYDCTRVWEAWSVGTMSQDDFEPITERLDEITETVLNAIAIESGAQATAPAPTGEAQADDAPTYTTEPGESTAGIALRELGDERRWREIVALNADRFPDQGPHDYYPVGTVLNMPTQAPSVEAQAQADKNSPATHWGTYFIEAAKDKRP